MPDVAAKIEALRSDRALCRRFRNDLRASRSEVQADAEGFEAVVHAIERLGRQFEPGESSLNSVERYLTSLVRSAVDDARARAFEARLFLLRQSRNDLAHRGAYARNAAWDAVRVALDLEEALTMNWSELTLGDLMVTEIVGTRPGDRLDDVRRALMSNAFTGLPAKVGDDWYIITDRWLASKLVGKSRDARARVLQRPVSELGGELPGPATLHPPGDRLGSLKPHDIEQALILVGTDGVLVGVVAPADLL